MSCGRNTVGKDSNGQQQSEHNWTLDPEAEPKRQWVKSMALVVR